MVFNITFNNISVISWQSVLLVEETNDSTGSYKSSYHTIMAISIIFSNKKNKTKQNQAYIHTNTYKYARLSKNNHENSQTWKCYIQPEYLIISHKHYNIPMHRNELYLTNNMNDKNNQYSCNIKYSG